MTEPLQVAEQIPTERIPLNVEVCLKPESCVAPEQVKSAVEALLRNRSILHRDGPLPVSWQQDPVLAPNVSGIAISSTDEHQPAGGATAPRVLLFWQLELRVLVYQLHEDGAAEEVEGEDELATYREWALPGRETHGLWEALMYDGTLKRRLLRYAASALHFADRQVDAQLVSWNRVVLLHGPPGTGKTSLCKALAHKLAIKLSHRYTQSQLVEVNAHSLFSKWFSESGKLVTKLFTKITELVEDEDSLVFVLIDEVESLTAARTAAVSGSEPSDAIRVVNALLTQLDALKTYPNVMVLTTTNITQAVDLAFVDRADLKVYIGPPNTHARYEILKSCLVELQRVGIIQPEGWELPAFTELQSAMDAAPQLHRTLLSPAAATESAQPSRREGEGDDMCMDHGTPGAASQPSRAHTCGAMLLSVAQDTEGFSGRILRKLPFLAHTHLTADTVRFEEFVHALRTTCELERADRASLT